METEEMVNMSGGMRGDWGDNGSKGEQEKDEVEVVKERMQRMQLALKSAEEEISLIDKEILKFNVGKMVT